MVPVTLINKLHECRMSGKAYIITPEQEEDLREFLRDLESEEAKNFFSAEALKEMKATTEFALAVVGRTPTGTVPLVLAKVDEFLNREDFTRNYLFIYEQAPEEYITSGTAVEAAKARAMVYNAAERYANYYDMTVEEFIFKMMRENEGR